MRPRHRHPRRALVLPLLLATLSSGCRGDADRAPGGDAAPAERPLLVYSGRSESLIGSLLERFQQQEGVEVRARYGETAEMAATLLEEGANSPADLFISQDAAALGALAAAGFFRPLPETILERVPARFRSPAGNWVGLSGRARTVVYNTERVRPEELPRRLEAVADPRYRGRFGVAPANASFQAHMAVFGVVAGRGALVDLLAGMAANDPRTYDKNGAIVQAVIAGEIDWGLVNHYYLFRALAEQPGAPAANFFMPEGAASSFVNLAGAGLVSGHPGAERLLAFLLGDPAQLYFAEETFEYPLATGALPAAGLPPLDQVATPDVDFGRVSAALEETLTLINESGLVR